MVVAAPFWMHGAWRRAQLLRTRHLHEIHRAGRGPSPLHLIVPLGVRALLRRGVGARQTASLGIEPGALTGHTWPYNAPISGYEVTIWILVRPRWLERSAIGCPAKNSSKSAFSFRCFFARLFRFLRNEGPDDISRTFVEFSQNQFCEFPT